jgi:hypothetical protein
MEIQSSVGERYKSPVARTNMRKFSADSPTVATALAAKLALPRTMVGFPLVRQEGLRRRRENNMNKADEKER